MTDYDSMGNESLQEMLAQASSYEERSAIRQVIRKRKKNQDQGVKAESRSRSSYNRFAGSTASKTSGSTAKSFEIPASARSQHSTAPELKHVPKQEKTAPPRRTRSPPPTSPDHASSQPNEEIPPEEEEAGQEPEEVEQEPEEAEQEPEEAEQEPEEAEQEPEEAGQEAEEPELTEEAGEAVEETDKPPVTEEPAEDVQETAEEGERDQVSEEADGGSGSGGMGLQEYLVAYVNHELQLDPSLPSQGKALYDTCADATVLCKLINKSVAGTVDLRALSKVRGTASQRREAVEDNMTLVVESARAIGCKVKDDTAEQIIQKDPGTIKNFLVDLIRARVVHLPGMEDEPSSSFSDWNYLFAKLKISVGNQSGSGREEAPAQQSWRENKSDSPALTYEQRAARRKAEREQRQKEKETESAASLTYEERAQQRKAERERRRREREALAK